MAECPIRNVLIFPFRFRRLHRTQRAISFPAWLWPFDSFRTARKLRSILRSRCSQHDTASEASRLTDCRRYNSLSVRAVTNKLFCRLRRQTHGARPPFLWCFLTDEKLNLSLCLKLCLCVCLIRFVSDGNLIADRLFGSNFVSVKAIDCEGFCGTQGRLCRCRWLVVASASNCYQSRVDLVIYAKPMYPDCDPRQRGNKWIRHDFNLPTRNTKKVLFWQKTPFLNEWIPLRDGLLSSSETPPQLQFPKMWGRQICASEFSLLRKKNE